ncbi:hypothetical protein AgCh_005811 [Apium graveolens]
MLMELVPILVLVLLILTISGFPCCRRDKEASKRPKPKKRGHKGGRWGVNAPQRLVVDVDEVDHGEAQDIGNYGSDFVDDGVGNLQGGENV